MDKVKLLNDLAYIIESGLAKTPIPHIQDNSIRIGKIIITPKSDGYIVYCLKTKNRLGKTYSKNAALALANKSHRALEILDLDRTYSKYDIDCMFYKHTLKHSKDDLKRDISEIRLSDAVDRRKAVADKLNKFIFF